MATKSYKPLVISRKNPGRLWIRGRLPSALTTWADSAVRAASAAEPLPRAASHGDALFHVLLALVAIIVAGRGLGWLFRWLGQPPVIGEVIAGILLGPSLLGRISPAAMRYVLPPAVAPMLSIIAQIGVILFMFLQKWIVSGLTAGSVKG